MITNNAKNSLNRWFNWPFDYKHHDLINFEDEFLRFKSKNQTIKVYRGVSPNDFTKNTGLNSNSLCINQLITYNTSKPTSNNYARGLRSWTTDIGTARDFAGKNGIVLKALVNINNILLNTSFLDRNNEHSTENEIILKPASINARIFKLPGTYLNLSKLKQVINNLKNVHTV